MNLDNLLKKQCYCVMHLVIMLCYCRKPFLLSSLFHLFSSLTPLFVAYLGKYYWTFLFIGVRRDTSLELPCTSITFERASASTITYFEK